MAAKNPDFENLTDLGEKELVTVIIGIVPALCSGWNSPANRVKYPMYQEADSNFEIHIRGACNAS